MKRLFLAWIPLATLSALSTAQHPITIGLDHIPVTVSDLHRAARTYRAIGFTLKPGRGHDNGIQNAHVKFPDGSGIELLTPAQAVDTLSSRYLALLMSGEGPAFLSFHARDTGQLHAALRGGGYEYRHDGNVTTLRSPEFDYLFFVRDNRSPTDQPGHFVHANGATAMSAVWIAVHDGYSLARLLVCLGGRQKRRSVLAPDPVEATVVTLAEGEVIILPERHQMIAGRPVVGVSFIARDLGRARQALATARIEPWKGRGTAERVVVDPRAAHGTWLEFRTGSVLRQER